MHFINNKIRAIFISSTQKECTDGRKLIGADTITVKDTTKVQIQISLGSCIATYGLQGLWPGFFNAFKTVNSVVLTNRKISMGLNWNKYVVHYIYQSFILISESYAVSDLPFMKR